MNAAGERYGIERLMRAVEQSGHLAAPQLCEAVLNEVRGWMCSQDDDLTLLVARHDVWH